MFVGLPRKASKCTLTWKLSLLFWAVNFFSCSIITRDHEGYEGHHWVEILPTGLPELSKLSRTLLKLRKAKFLESTCSKKNEKLICSDFDLAGGFGTWKFDYMGEILRRIRISGRTYSLFASRPRKCGKTNLIENSKKLKCWKMSFGKSLRKIRRSCTPTYTLTLK